MYIIISKPFMFKILGIKNTVPYNACNHCVEVTEERFLEILAAIPFIVSPDNTPTVANGLFITYSDPRYITEYEYTRAKNILTKPSDVV